MKITIIAVGKIKEEYLKSAIAEYHKRIGKYAKINIIELLDEKIPEKLSNKEANIIKNIEGQRILKKIKTDGFIFVLEINGKMINSEEFANYIDSKKISGYSHFYFIIGGSLGLSSDVIEKSDFKISFSKMTFPHQLMRVILLEQIYRGFKIIKGEPYHK